MRASKVVLALCCAAGAAADTAEYDIAALAARVRELETSLEKQQSLQNAVTSRRLDEAATKEDPIDDDMISVDLDDPRVAQQIGAARRTSFHFHAQRHKIMRERHERRMRSGATTRRNLQDFVGSDEFCWSMDHCWVIVAGLICFFLQGGFGLLETGACRAKNAKNIMLKNLMDACVGGFVYYCFGWALAHGGETTNEKGVPNGNTFAGNGQWMLLPHKNIEAYGYYLWFFNYVFAATIATIVSGAVAERIQFRAYMIYSVLLTGFLYPICSHWIWSPDGFLYRAGVVDFAGGGAVHALSGVAALMGALALGPRDGVFAPDGKYKGIKAHDTSMMALGLFVFWFGFIPFNAGSGLSLCGFFSANLTARIAVITTIGGCSGGIVSLMYGWYAVGHSSLEYAISGVLAGMIAVCSCCPVVDPWAIFWVISPLGVASFWGCDAALKYFKIDDPLNASALHYGPGIVGMLAVGFFGSERFTADVYLNGYDGAENKCFPLDGLTKAKGTDDFIFYKHRKNDPCTAFYGVFFGGTGKQLGWQLAASLLYTVWGVVGCGLIFFPMKWVGILRVDIQDEREGLDITHHGGSAYEWYEPVSALPEAKVEQTKALPVAAEAAPPEEAAYIDEEEGKTD